MLSVANPWQQVASSGTAFGAIAYILSMQRGTRTFRARTCISNAINTLPTLLIKTAPYLYRANQGRTVPFLFFRSPS